MPSILIFCTTWTAGMLVQQVSFIWCNNCAFCDESMKFSIVILHNIWLNFRCGPTCNMTSSDLERSMNMSTGIWQLYILWISINPFKGYSHLLKTTKMDNKFPHQCENYSDVACDDLERSETSFDPCYLTFSSLIIKDFV